MSVTILTNQTTNQEFLDFVVDEIHNAVISTVNQDNLPSAQVCDLLMNKDGKLYITTSSKNHPFYDDLNNAKQILIDGYKGNGTMDSCGFSIKADVKNIGHKYMDEVWQKNPYLNEIYKDNVEQAKDELRIFEITPLEAGYLDHRTTPIFMRKFEF